MKYGTRRVIATLGMAAALCGWSSNAEALLAGVKITGMAATTTAYPQDSFVAAYNPAGIAFLCNRIDLGAVWDQTGQKAEIVGNSDPSLNGTYPGDRTKDFYLAESGMKVSLPKNFSAGVVVYNRNFVKTTYNTNFPLFGTSNLGLEYLNETVAPTIAYRFWDTQSVGLSVNFQFQRLKNNGLEELDQALPVGGTTVAPGFVTNNGYNWSSGVGVTLGWYGRFFCDTLGLGLAYSPQTKMQSFRRYRGFLANSGKFNLPQRWIAGIAYKWIPCSTIAFDAEWVDWPQVKALANPINILAGFTDPDARLGGPQGTGYGFRSQTFYRLGIDYRIGSVTLRTGYRYARQPNTSSQTAANILLLDAVEQFFTLGATWEVNPCNELSFFYAHGFRHTIYGQDSIPVPFFGGGEANLTQRKNALGVAWGYKY